MNHERFLIVDDRPENLYLLQALLQGHGCTVDLAANGKEALEAAHRQPPDIIVTDVLMPVMDGFALCRVWKSDPALAAIPFVIYTATYTDEKDRQFALSLGADAFVLKPQEPEAFLAIVEDVLAAARTATGEQAPAAGAAETSSEAVDEESYLKHYNEALVRKLEAKMLQLESANRRLEEDIVARTAAEAEVRSLNETLEERVAERTAQLRAANRELEAFSYSVSHDLRAPLRAISGFAAILVEDYAPLLDDEGRRYCSVITRNAARMGQLIDDLLAFSRVGRAAFTVADVDMAALADACFRDVTAEETRARIAVSIAALPRALGDASLLREVWMNLLGNAVKFSAKREAPVISVTGERQGREVVYMVRDNGAGFDPARADKIFDVFERLHSVDEFEGTGIGLALVRKIVQRHGGRIWAHGVLGEGATVWFALPAAE